MGLETPFTVIPSRMYFWYGPSKEGIDDESSIYQNLHISRTELFPEWKDYYISSSRRGASFWNRNKRAKQITEQMANKEVMNLIATNDKTLA
jgi:hypothetical protein